MLYPPFCDIVVFGFSALTEKDCKNAASLFAGMLSENAAPLGRGVPLRILGPAPNTIGKLNGRFRYRLILKCINSSALRGLVGETMKQAAQNAAFANVSFYADMNGGMD